MSESDKMSLHRFTIILSVRLLFDSQGPSTPSILVVCAFRYLVMRTSTMVHFPFYREDLTVCGCSSKFCKTVAFLVGRLGFTRWLDVNPPCLRDPTPLDRGREHG